MRLPSRCFCTGCSCRKSHAPKVDGPKKSWRRKKKTSGTRSKGETSDTPVAFDIYIDIYIYIECATPPIRTCFARNAHSYLLILLIYGVHYTGWPIYPPSVIHISLCVCHYIYWAQSQTTLWVWAEYISITVYLFLFSILWFYHITYNMNISVIRMFTYLTCYTYLYLLSYLLHAFCSLWFSAWFIGVLQCKEIV